MDETLAALYGNLALPPEPMHFSIFLSHGGNRLILTRMERGQVSGLDDEHRMAMVRWALDQGPEAGAARGAVVPMPEGPARDLAKALWEDIQAAKAAAAPDTSDVWGVGLRRLENGEPVNHLDRFKILMSLLRAGWDDEAIQASFARSPKYDREKTAYYIRHARGKYL